MDRICIIHYEGHETYSELKDVSEINEERINNAKTYRATLDGDNLHTEQCNSIPTIIDHSKHAIHSVPCYKKFTYILKDYTPQKTDFNRRKSDRKLPVDSSSNLLFPTICYFCKKTSKKVGGKLEKKPTKITTLTAENTIKNAAKSKDPNMYFMLQDQDLIARELMYHLKCYRDFTYGFSASFTSQEQSKVVKDIETSSNDKGDYDAVTNYINNRVLKENCAVSMEVLHNVYKLNVKDSRYRNKLKNRLLVDFGNKIEFLKPSNGQMPEVVVNKNVMVSEIKFDNKNEQIVSAAEFLRDDISKYSEQLTELSWPPTLEELNSKERKPPPLLIKFLQHLLKSSDKHSIIRSENISRLVSSYASDIIHGVTKGKVVTGKHYLLALGLHNLTGSRKVIDINNKLGHCLSYNRTCEIETALAEKAQQLSLGDNALPLQPLNDSDIVLTYFWVDNFDMIVDKQSGGGSINTTHLMAFQELTSKSIERNETLTVPYRKSRTINPVSKEVIVPFVNKIKEPPLFSQTITQPEDVDIINDKYFTWLWLRHQNQFDQVLPNFPGWLLQHRHSENLKKTITTYLPPITSKVTDYVTIETYMEYLQSLAQNVNMPYVNITLDVGAAMNAYRLLWNNQVQLSNVFIHLGDFHFIKENFQVIGKLVSESGFEDVVFESDLCTSGSLRGVIFASNYNRAWLLHSEYSEGMERLLVLRFTGELRPNVPDYLISLSADPTSFKNDSLEHIHNFAQLYNEFKMKVRLGQYGKTAQFWLIYLDLMKVQHIIHTAVQENDYELRLYAWQYFIPYYFAFDKQNYARYGSYYLESMLQIEENYPGLKDLLKNNGLSVLAQENHNVRTAIDQRGAQTINRDAKTAGGITSFASNDSSVLKWCLNRADQAKNTKALNDMCGISPDAGLYKPLRPRQIIQTNERVKSVMKTLCENYINPFSIDIEKNHLINLSSGVPLPDDVADRLLSVYTIGMDKYREFKNERLIKPPTKSFHEPITRCKVIGFGRKKVKVAMKNSVKAIEINRDILAKILSASIKSGKPIDFEKSLQYPLSPLPLSLCNADGTIRKTNKSELLKILLENNDNVEHPKIVKENTVYIVDFMAAIRSIHQVPKTFEELAFNIIKGIPQNYKRIDIVSDTYKENSIKSGERQKRGKSDKVLVKSAKSKIPPDFNNFLSNSDNKTRMIELLFSVIESHKAKFLNMLKTNQIILSRQTFCRSLTLSKSEDVECLITAQEEADTKIFLHCNEILKEDNTLDILIKSPSGDTDIVVLGISLFGDTENVFIENGTGQNKKLLSFKDFEFSISKKRSLIGFHAFTGNDYNASFFRKGKRACWNILSKHSKFEDTFNQLGNELHLDPCILDKLEEFVCYLYGYQEKSINSVRFKMFTKKHKRENKVPDLSTFPPCHQVLEYHSKRSNAIAYIWKHSTCSQVDDFDLQEAGWEINSDIHWFDECFPVDIEDIVINEDDIDSDIDSNDEFMGSDVESNNESDSDNDL